MHVRQIDTRRATDVEKFVRFPLVLYRDCPQWAPPLLTTMRRSLDRAQHPFYAHSEADFFVVESADGVLGRIGVLNNQSYNRHHQRRTGFFCYFDVVDDPAAARALFDAAFDWMRARKLNEAFGPHGLLKLDRGGVLVDGFAHRAAMGVAYNHPYYDRFLRDAGFVKEFDLLSGRLDEGHHLSERIREISEKVKARSGLHIKTFASKKELRAWIPRIVAAYEDAYRDFALYYPRTDAERTLIADEMLSVADPSMIKLVLEMGLDSHLRINDPPPCYEISGINMTIDMNSKSGDRITAIQVKQPDGSYADMDMNADYTMATTDYLADIGIQPLLNKLSWLGPAADNIKSWIKDYLGYRALGLKDVDAMSDYLRVQKNIKNVTEERSKLIPVVK